MGRREPRQPDLRSLTLADLESHIAELGQPRYRAQQVFQWLHRHRVTSLDAMRNTPKELRDKLAHFDLTTLSTDEVQTSSDGTRKLRLRCTDGAAIEAVLIPRADKLTLCVSSQVGCALGCRFCATATMGIIRNLSPGEIVDQVYRAASLLGPDERISNLVFMGMGEPMANLDAVLDAITLLRSSDGMDFSPRRITVSTVGMVPGIRKLGQRMRDVGLAISLHATTDTLRDSLMPINKRWPLSELMAALRDFPLPRRRRITFEYIVLDGLNNTVGDADRLVKLLNGIPAKVNLLPYNPWRKDQPDLKRPTEDDLEDFAEALRERELTTTVRYSRGLDIDAACGQLALKA